MIGLKANLILIICVQKGNAHPVILDSLMKGYRLAPKGDYLVARAIKDAKKIKKEKKRMKKETIKKGGSHAPCSELY